MERYHMKKVSKNDKTGPIPVSTSPRQSCPDSCAFKGAGCFGDNFPLSIHWAKVSEAKRGEDWAEFIKAVETIRRGQLWRHNQVGDLPKLGDTGDTLDAAKLDQLTIANKGRKGFTYTHYPLTIESNARAIKSANLGGFTVNLSANNPAHADELAAANVGPVVTVIRSDAAKVTRTPEGRKIVACLAQTRDGMTCDRCKLCAVADRDYIIGFYPHGARKKQIEKTL